jgi:hypothetical protein
MRIEGQLERLIGAGASALFRDARRLADDGLGLEAQGTLVWHCAREIESAIREALGPVAPIDAVANAKRIHAAEIEAIIKELGLDATDPAIAWWKARALSGLAHRASLGPPRPFAPGDWQTFLTALELILGAFETRYLRMIATLDDLLAMTPAKAGKRTGKLLCSVPPTGQANALKHFFERADATWLRALPDCILDDPPGREFAIDQPGYFRWPQWHASRYLAKVAPLEPARVFEKVMKVLKTQPENPWIHIDFVAAAAHFPPDEKATWAVEEAAWVRVQAGLFMPLSRDFAEAVKMLAEAGLTDPSFALGEAVLALGDGEPRRHGEPSLRADEYEYGKALKSIAETLTALDARRSATFLTDLLDRAEAQAYEETRDRWSTIWRSSIADDGTNDSGHTLEKLADALRDALDLAVTDLGALEAMHASLVARAGASSVLRRFAIHVATVGRDVSPDLARATSLDPATYTADSWVEAHRLIEAIGPGLDATGSDEIVVAVRASTVDASRQDELVAVLDGFRVGATPEPIVGQPMFRSYPYVPPPSPVSAERMAQWSVPKTVRFLTNWQSNPAQHRDGDMLEFAFLEAVKANPARWSGAGVKVLNLPPNFLQRYLWALRESAKDGATLNGDALVRLFDAGLVTGRSWLGGDYQDVRKSVAWILRDCLGGDRLALTSSASRTALWAVIGALLTDPSGPTASGSGGDADELALAALNHTRSVSTSLVVTYALWLNRHQSGPRRLTPEAQRLLEDRLDPDEASLEVRFSVGEHLAALRWLDPAWTDGILPRVFPGDEASALIRDAAWRGFLWRGQVPLDLFVALRPEYRHAIEGLDSAGETTKAHERLAEHVLLLARIGTIGPQSEDGLLPLLFSRAGADLARQAVHDLGWWLYNVRNDATDPEEVARLRAFWDWLAAEVEADRANPASLEPFGWWFASGKFDQDWSFDELERLARADVEIDFMHIVYERLLALVPGNPERVGRVTEAIVAHEVRPDDLHGSELPATVRVLVDPASGPEANRSGRAIIGMMVSRGFANFPGS